MEWFYEKNGEQHGPITEIDLKGMYGNGELTRSNLVWREGMADWTAFGTVFELEEGAPQKTASTIVPRSQRTQRGNSCGELRADAWDALSGNWLMAALVIFLMQVVMQASSMAAIIPLIGFLVPIFVAGPLTVGMYSYFLRLVRREPVEIGELFSGFTLWLKHTGLFLLVTFIIVCSAMVAAIPGGALMGVVVANNQVLFEQSPDLAAQDPLFLTGLVLIVLLPTLVATYFWIRYAFVYFIVADEPEMPVGAILRRSSQMMQGQVWKFSWLILSYTGWFILGMLAFFVGIFWASAYWMAGFAAYYDDLRERV
ncbi:MAG: DUF975 family protein [Opitutaceae bacterium]